MNGLGKVRFIHVVWAHQLRGPSIEEQRSLAVRIELVVPSLENGHCIFYVGVIAGCGSGQQIGQNAVGEQGAIAEFEL